jgi:hypothetical protein
VSFGVIALGLLRSWQVVAVIAVCALVLLLFTLARPVGAKPPAKRREPVA